MKPFSEAVTRLKKGQLTDVPVHTDFGYHVMRVDDERATKAARPDVIAPITRPASAQLLLPEIAKQRIEMMGIVGPGSPGLYEAGQIAALRDHLEYVLTSVPWPNFKNPRAQRLASTTRTPRARAS